MDDGPPDRQGGKSSRAELGGSGLTPLKATRARSAEEDPDEAVIVPDDGEPPGDGDDASDAPNSGSGGADDARAPPPRTR